MHSFSFHSNGVLCIHVPPDRAVGFVPIQVPGRGGCDISPAVSGGERVPGPSHVLSIPGADQPVLRGSYPVYPGGVAAPGCVPVLPGPAGSGHPGGRHEYPAGGEGVAAARVPRPAPAGGVELPTQPGQRPDCARGLPHDIPRIPAPPGRVPTSH